MNRVQILVVILKVIWITWNGQQFLPVARECKGREKWAWPHRVRIDWYTAWPTWVIVTLVCGQMLTWPLKVIMCMFRRVLTRGTPSRPNYVGSCVLFQSLKRLAWKSSCLKRLSVLHPGSHGCWGSFNRLVDLRPVLATCLPYNSEFQILLKNSNVFCWHWWHSM